MHPIRIILPLVFIVAFLGYVIYLIATKKDKRAVRQIFLPGVFFIAVWCVIYFLILN